MSNDFVARGWKPIKEAPLNTPVLVGQFLDGELDWCARASLRPDGWNVLWIPTHDGDIIYGWLPTDGPHAPTHFREMP